MRKLHVECEAQYAQLRALEQMRDSPVHMLVHDLRSPLQGITLSLDLAIERVRELDESVLLADLDEVCGSVRVLGDMVGDVLDVSRLESGAMPLKRQHIDLHDVARDAIASVGRTDGVAVEIISEAMSVCAFADRAVVRRVIANLLGNAYKFTKRGGTVNIQILRRGELAEFSVIDSGPGIAPEHHSLIFEKFGQVQTSESTRTRSSGLGLAFCKLAIEANGGTIGVTSKPGFGSTFRFTLPTEYVS